MNARANARRAVLLLVFAASAAAVSGADVDYVYDSAGRLVRAAYDGGPTITYTYDPSGNLLSRTASGVSPFPVPPTMTASRSASQIEIRYSTTSCHASDHLVVFGSLGQFGATTAAVCSIGGDGTATVPAPGDSIWFLVAGVESSAYSSLGSGDSSERLVTGIGDFCPGVTQDVSLTCE